MKHDDYSDVLRDIAKEAAGHQQFSSIVKAHPVALERELLDALYADREQEELDIIRRQLAKAGLM